MGDSETEADAGADDRHFTQIDVAVQMEDHQIQVNSGRRAEFVFPIDIDADVCVVRRSRSCIRVRGGQRGGLILESPVHRDKRKRFAGLTSKSEAMGINNVANCRLIVEDAGREIDRNLGNVAADTVAHPDPKEGRLRKTSDRGNGYVPDGSLGAEDIADRELGNGHGKDTRFHLSVLEMIFQAGRGSRDDGPHTSKYRCRLDSILRVRLRRNRLKRFLGVPDQRSNPDELKLDVQPHVAYRGGAIKSGVEIRPD